jgi:hypothetical protein
VKRSVIHTSLVAALALAGAACESSSGDPSSSPEPRRCAPPLVVPEGFEVTGGLEDPHYDDHVGVRIDLVDADRRELHFFSGMRGEFGEGLPGRHDLDLGGGVTGILLGRDTTWVLQWETAPPCTPTVVLGTGMDRHAFEELLRDAGAFSQEPAPTPSQT